MQDGWRHDLEAMADAVDDKTKLIIVCNPNNPTGTYNTLAEFEAFLARVPEHVIVAVDEAYYEYVVATDYPQVLPMLAEHPNLMTLRTFSKIHSLAGLRVGFGVGHPALMGELQKTREPFNVNMLSQAAAIACLEHWDQVAPRAQRNRQQLEWMAAALVRARRHRHPQPDQLHLLHPGRPQGRRAGAGAPGAGRHRPPHGQFRPARRPGRRAHLHRVAGGEPALHPGPRRRPELGGGGAAHPRGIAGGRGCSAA